jgi:phage FluMu gp28-like protein
MSNSKNPGRQIVEAETEIVFRDYQWPVYFDHQSGIVVLHWSRQIGKSFTLAAWAVERLLLWPGRLVTVLSNSRENGVEFLNRCAEICRLRRAKYDATDESPNLDFKNLRLEIRIKRKGRTGRIKILAANPRTARGFSGDLILDEFAFHENSAAIWEAAEPILASNPDFLCRIASTGNGRHNLFYRLAAPAMSPPAGASPIPPDAICHGYSQSGFLLSRVTRTQAHQFGVKIYDPRTREPISPEEARAQALDKRAYDQNYECAFADENLTLLSHELISAAERAEVGFICEQDWGNVVVEGIASSMPKLLPDATSRALDFLREAKGNFYIGLDVGRSVDLSVLTVMEDLDGQKIVRGILRMQNLRLPEQQARLGEICRLPKFRRAAIDMTGLGLGLFEYAQDEFGAGRIAGINFARTVPATRAIVPEGRKRETVRVTEALAMELLQAYEDRRIWHPADGRLRDDLRKPEKRTTPGGRVSIAATRDEAGHADHFWSLALALEAAGSAGGEFHYRAVRRDERGVLV